MSWLQSLFDTYVTCYGHEPDGSARLMPIAHTTQQAHVEIVLDGQGNFRRAEILEKERRTTQIPCTEASGGRSGSKPTSHPLCDKLQYVAADFAAFGGEVTSGFLKAPGEPHRLYLDILSDWSASTCGHAKLDAILRYVNKGQVVADLVEHLVLPVDEQGKLLKEWEGTKAAAPPIYSALPSGQLPEDAFVRWAIEGDQVAAGVWEDSALIDAWITYYARTQTARGYCFVSGQETTLAAQHPAKLRNAADKAKLISANDSTGFTYRGRFIEAEQVVGVGYESTQKAHNALRWLIERQGSRNGDQVVVSWTVSGKDVPNPMTGSDDEFGDIGPSIDASAGEGFARRLRLAIQGYQAKLNPSDDVYVIALDSATPGRMSITFFRRLQNSEYLHRIEDWHVRFCWLQNYGKDRKFVGAPSPRDIAQAAYGRRLDSKLEAATRERILPCIVDQVSMPQDLANAACERAANRVGMDRWEWKKCLGIACALYKGINYKRNYQMNLETDRSSRDYLYGRLLALAENIESFALSISDESRETNAARMMHRFSKRPYSTWLILNVQQLAPYKARLQSKAPDFLVARSRLMDEIHGQFAYSDFTDDSPLSGEFLLGYHCQRMELVKKKEKPEAAIEIDKN